MWSKKHILFFCCLFRILWKFNKFKMHKPQGQGNWVSWWQQPPFASCKANGRVRTDFARVKIMRHDWGQVYCNDNGNYVKVNIRWWHLSPLLQLSSENTGNLRLLHSCRDPQVCDWIIHYWEDFPAQEEQNPAVLIRLSLLTRSTSYPDLPLLLVSLLLNGQLGLTLKQSRKASSVKETKMNKKELRGHEVGRKTCFQSFIVNSWTQRKDWWLPQGVLGGMGEM